MCVLTYAIIDNYVNLCLIVQFITVIVLSVLITLGVFSNQCYHDSLDVRKRNDDDLKESHWLFFLTAQGLLPMKLTHNTHTHTHTTHTHTHTHIHSHSHIHNS